MQLTRQQRSTLLFRQCDIHYKKQSTKALLPPNITTSFCNPSVYPRPVLSGHDQYTYLTNPDGRRTLRIFFTGDFIFVQIIFRHIRFIPKISPTRAPVYRAPIAIFIKWFLTAHKALHVIPKYFVELVLSCMHSDKLPYPLAFHKGFSSKQHDAFGETSKSGPLTGKKENIPDLSMKTTGAFSANAYRFHPPSSWMGSRESQRPSVGE